MLATSYQALDHLRHKRTGEVLATKNVQRNTKLVYYCDELIALRFHKTDIAHFMPDGVRLDVRANGLDPSPNDQGWFTITTWARIDEFTSARTYTHRGIRHVNDRLYAHGMFIRPDGSIESPLEPEQDAAICRVMNTYPQRFRRHAARVAEAWKSWGEVSLCCRDAEDIRGHTLDHVEANEPAIPSEVQSFVESLRMADMHGERLMAKLTAMLRKSFKPLLGVAVNRTCPEFPYPQLTKAT